MWWCVECGGVWSSLFDSVCLSLGELGGGADRERVQVWIRTDYVNTRFITVVLPCVAWLRSWHPGVVARCVGAGYVYTGFVTSVVPCGATWCCGVTLSSLAVWWRGFTWMGVVCGVTCVT